MDELIIKVTGFKLTLIDLLTYTLAAVKTTQSSSDILSFQYNGLKYEFKSKYHMAGIAKDGLSDLWLADNLGENALTEFRTVFPTGTYHSSFTTKTEIVMLVNDDVMCHITSIYGDTNNA